MNLSRNLENTATIFPDRTAVIDGNSRMTYKSLNENADQIAFTLTETGIQKGDHIGICLPNSSFWLTVYFGILKAGAIAVTLPYAMTQNEIDPVLDDCRPRIVFTDITRKSDFDTKDYIQSILLDHGPNTSDNAYQSHETIECCPDDTAAILYTGGTTGIPKGVMLTHRNIISSAFNVAYYERSSENDTALCFLPLNHVFAQIHIMNSTILSAGGIVIQASFNINTFLEAITEHQVTKLYSVPTVYTRLLSQENLKEKLGSVRYCFSAAASMAKELVREWKTRTGLEIYEAYGMTESASMVTYNHYHNHVVGSVGTPANGVEVQVRDEQGNVLGRNQKGEICIAGPNIMKGYLNRPEDTEKAFWGRWFRSGDVGIIDDSSYLYIVDRIKELVITGGENVSPREIEEILYERHEIEECAVIGLPDREYGERVVAYIVSRGNHAIDPIELKTYLKKKLSGFKVPKQFIQVEQLPKSSAGKLLKRELKEQVLDGAIAGR